LRFVFKQTIIYSKHMNAKIPTWIVVYGLALTALGIVTGIMGYLNPSSLATGIDGSIIANKLAVYSWAARNIGTALVIPVALLSKRPAAIMIVFLVRALIETQDTVIKLATGTGSISVQAGTAAVLVALFVVPEIIITVKMYRLSKLQDI
jgi:hypothetical protein